VLSKRSAEIDAAIAEVGHATYQARQVAARTTRRAKRHTPEAELLPVWRGELDAAGLGVDRLGRMVLEDARDAGPPQRLSSRAVDAIVTEALAADGPLAQRKVFTRADVIVAVAPALFGQDPDVLSPVVSRVLRHPEAIPLVGVAAARDQAYAPACVVAVEAAIAEVMERAAACTTAPTIGFRAVEQAIWAEEATLGNMPLTVGQTNAAIALATSGRGGELVLGVAGAGKTTMLDVVRAAFETDGYRVARHIHVGAGGPHPRRPGPRGGAHGSVAAVAPRARPAPPGDPHRAHPGRGGHDGRPGPAAAAAGS
jgi:hypothetical protein